MSLREKLSSHALRYLQPRNATPRQYETLRAYCVERLPVSLKNANVARLDSSKCVEDHPARFERLGVSHGSSNFPTKAE